MADAIHDFADHVVRSGFDDLDPETVGVARSFILDTIGVGLAGSSGPKADALPGIIASAGAGGDARVWSTGQRLPAASAALCNAYQVHNAEFDCLHERAVAHVMTLVLPVALAGAERMGDVSGKRLIEAVVLGVDVAACLGISAQSGLRFFRPATVGAFGATAALGKLMGLDREGMVQAFSLAYGQLCGTMQAHSEGVLLAIQMGFNARNAVVACEMAAAGIAGPRNILEGPFGYFKLFESAGDPQKVLGSLGQIWRINELAYKPFPTGRATHGIIDACLTLQREHSFVAGDIAEIRARVPPLVHHLVGRPVKTEMDINYARLCAAYTAACALLTGTVGPEDFAASAYADPKRQALAKKVIMEVAQDDPNALSPVEVEILLNDGAAHRIRLEAVYGAPERPMSREAVLAKFRANCRRSASVPDDVAMESLISACDALERLPDVRELVDLMT